MRILLVILLLFPQFLLAQTVSIYFSKDSVRLGEQVEVAVTFNHAPQLAVLFPDSTWNFYPFEFVSKKFFTTRTQGEISKDCTIYRLRSFEVQKKLEIKLPVFVITETDTIVNYSAPVYISLKELTDNTENAELISETTFYSIPDSLNYPLIMLYTFAVLAVFFLFWLFFGKPVRRRYLIATAFINHRTFIKSFDQVEQDYQNKKEVQLLEQLLTIWKNYLSKLENKPVSTYTSTEIINLYGTDDLKNSLQIIDRAIFGGIVSEEDEKAIRTLKNFSIKRYIRRKNEIKNN